MITDNHPNGAIAAREGDTAPDFTLVGTDEGAHSLSAATQQGPAVLVFYRGDWCAPCKNQLLQMSAVHDRFQTAGATVWAISPQDGDINRALRDQLNLAFPILADADQGVMRAWGVFNEAASKFRAMPFPATYVVDGDGLIRWRHVGLQATDQPAVGEVLAAVTALNH